jgi:hypothetical protein
MTEESDMERLFKVSETELAQEPSVEALLERAAMQSPRYQSPPMAPKPTVADITEERGKTHGPFRDNARVSQMLKAVMRATASWQYLDDVEKEALDNIALKISRILSGKSLERQHWEDVEGYAHLAVKECDA